VGLCPTMIRLASKREYIIFEPAPGPNNFGLIYIRHARHDKEHRRQDTEQVIRLSVNQGVGY
jgi:hypothetical protein